MIVEEAGGRVVGGFEGEVEAAVVSSRVLVVRASEGRKGQEEMIKEFWGAVKGKLEYEY